MPEESIQDESMPANIHNHESMAGDEEINSTVTGKTHEKANQPTKAQYMEVYHPHVNHHERKIKDYFFEFFMLFLAVTAGFFMENIRESYADRQKEKQYISSLIRDIQEDTVSIRNIIEINEMQVKCIDSLLQLLEKPVSKIDTRRLYYFVNQYLTSLRGFSVREVTITQLRNSGGLRLISNKSVSDSIVIYYGTYDSHVDQKNYNYKIFQEILDLEMQILDFGAYRLKNREMTFDTSRIKQFYNRILIYNSILSYEVKWLKDYQTRGTSLLKHLKEAYSLEL